MVKRNVVVDTNCLLMMIPTRSPWRKVWDAYREGKFVMCVSTGVLDEYHEILSQKASPSVAENIIQAITNSPFTRFFSPQFRFEIIKQDPDDNKFVDLAIVAQAEYLVSNDKHFEEARACPFPSVNVVTLSEFAHVL
ncbi:MAG: putative toxin-antitoxin system toxin component, PIN family [Bacteroidaceae bacterium]|nr:putative toxin-antitoxin system toxin component, PIN family [Bacteroidaceae bacterium]